MSTILAFAWRRRLRWLGGWRWLRRSRRWRRCWFGCYRRSWRGHWFCFNRLRLWRGGGFFRCHSCCFFRRSFRVLSFLDQTAHRVRRLRTLADPMLDPVQFKGAVLPGLFWIVSADDFDEFSIARTACVRDTTLKYGRFNAPSLRNLIATAMLFSHSLNLRHHLFHFPRVLHHFSHLIEAPDQIVHLRDG